MNNVEIHGPPENMCEKSIFMCFKMKTRLDVDRQIMNYASDNQKSSRNQLR